MPVLSGKNILNTGVINDGDSLDKTGKSAILSITNKSFLMVQN